MNFAEFQQRRKIVLRERGDVLDCAETNLYRALARLIPSAMPQAEGTVHRCHLAAEWAARFGLSAAAQRALCSCGVRDSLAILFRHYSAENVKLWLPSDNYPVYGELARTAGLMPDWFPTLPQPCWPANAPGAAPELLVVTNPLKPLGRWLDANDEDALLSWLAADSRRRLLLDAVYTFATEFHSSTLRLLATNQTILLHSLTKGWLHPRLFGIALVPEADAAALAPAFRTQPPPQPNLARARELIAHAIETPISVANELARARERLLNALPTVHSVPQSGTALGYFTIVPGSAAEWLEKENILGIPVTAFGSLRADLTILSSLRFVE